MKKSIILFAAILLLATVTQAQCIKFALADNPFELYKKVSGLTLDSTANQVTASIIYTLKIEGLPKSLLGQFEQAVTATVKWKSNSITNTSRVINQACLDTANAIIARKQALIPR